MSEAFFLNHQGLIGPESQFARKMRSEYPNDDVAIIKVSAGSSRMEDWEPLRRDWIDYANRFQRRIEISPLLFYRHLRPTVDVTVKSLKLTYGAENVEVAGFVWIQGESDLLNFAGSPAQQKFDDYRDTLEHMIESLRFSYNRYMPFTICLTKGYKGIDFDRPNPPYHRSNRARRLQDLQISIANEDRLGRGRWVYTQFAQITDHQPPAPRVDTVHWNAYSMNVIGLWIANEFLSIPPPPLK